jgi:serine O-acetyltransferase
MDKKVLNEIINADLYRYFGRTSFKIFFKGLKIPGFKYTYLLRKCYFYKKNDSKIKYLFFSLLLKKYTYKFGFNISPTCKIGKGFYIGHFGRVIITPYTEIGSNVNISPGVTIGQTNRGKNKGVPKIGNNVWVGTNAIIVGNIQIGNNVLIAPGAYVNFNVPNNAVILGNPGKIVSYKGTDDYVNRKID